MCVEFGICIAYTCTASLKSRSHGSLAVGAVACGSSCGVSVVAAWTVDQHQAVSTEVPGRKGQPCYEGRAGSQRRVVG